MVDVENDYSYCNFYGSYIFMHRMSIRAGVNTAWRSDYISELRCHTKAACRKCKFSTVAEEPRHPRCSGCLLYNEAAFMVHKI